jgi:hypothetical protein
MRRVTLLALSLCLLVGCAGFPDGGGAGAAELPPGSTTLAAGTARATVTWTDGRTTVEGTGPVDLEHRRSSLAFADRFDAVVVRDVAYLRRHGSTAWRTVRAAEVPQADPVQLLEVLGDAPLDAFDRVGPGRYELAGGPLTVTVWLDDQGRVRRERVRLGTGGLTSTTTLELDRFGMPARVRVPDHARTARGLADALR